MRSQIQEEVMGKLLNGLIRKSLFGVGAAVLLSVSMGVSAQGIQTSKHDLTSTGTGGNRVTNGSPEICVFCHTPHGSDSAAPLWNKNLSSPPTYTQYSSSTMDGVAVTGGISLACLSCHDGSQAMDSMINRPGSGLYDPTGVARAYSGNTWSSNVDGKMVAGVFNLGTDLSNDHPIQIPYCGGGMTAAGATITMTGCADADFKTPIGNATGTQKVWFDTGSTASAKDKGDIQLYNRAGGAVFYVECGSCHDPHNTANGTFLRISNAASAVCLTCHNK
jgi:predicted CXXCH cytochrome family protein